MAKRYKICRCCGTVHAPSKRKCRVCKTPPIWDLETDEQMANRLAANATAETNLQNLIAKRDECCV